MSAPKDQATAGAGQRMVRVMCHISPADCCISDGEASNRQSSCIPQTVNNNQRGSPDHMKSVSLRETTSVMQTVGLEFYKNKCFTLMGNITFVK